MPKFPSNNSTEPIKNEKTMGVSAQQLRDEFKTHLQQWEGKVDSQAPDQQIFFEIKQWAEEIEQHIDQKINLLAADFNEFQLKDEYLRSVSEGFDNLEDLMRKKQALPEIIHGDHLEKILKKIKIHYSERFTPLLNILSKLENDYISIATRIILDKMRLITLLEKDLKDLSTEKKNLESKVFDLNRKKKLIEFSKKIKHIELKRKITRLTLHHDRLNLYYFTHDRPAELKVIKEKADQLRTELSKLEEKEHGSA